MFISLHSARNAGGAKFLPTDNPHKPIGGTAENDSCKGHNDDIADCPVTAGGRSGSDCIRYTLPAGAQYRDRKSLWTGIVRIKREGERWGGGGGGRRRRNNNC